MWAPEVAGVKQPPVSDKGSGSTYAVRFWGQVLRKYLRGTQGHPDLCFGGFSTYGEPMMAMMVLFKAGFMSSCYSL